MFVSSVYASIFWAALQMPGSTLVSNNCLAPPLILLFCYGKILATWLVAFYNSHSGTKNVKQF